MLVLQSLPLPLLWPLLLPPGHLLQVCAGTLAHSHWHIILPTSQEPRSSAAAAADYDTMLYTIDFTLPVPCGDVCAALCD